MEQVLKGPVDLKTVKLQTTAEVVAGPVRYKEGASGIWILRKLKDSDLYVGGNPTSLQPTAKLDEVKAEVAKQSKQN